MLNDLSEWREHTPNLFSICPECRRYGTHHPNCPCADDEPGIDPVLIEAKARELAEDGFCSVDANAAAWLASLTSTQAEARDTFMRASIIHYMSGDGYDQQRDALEPLREAFISTQWLAYLDAATDALETA